MDPLTWFVVAVIASFASKAVETATKGMQAGQAHASKVKLSRAIDKQAEASRTKLEHEYRTTLDRLAEQEGGVIGLQQALLGSAGHAGGAGTLGAVAIDTARARRRTDEDLLTQQYEDTLAELNAEVNLAKEQLDANYRTTMTELTAGVFSDWAELGADIASAGLSAYQLRGNTLLSGGTASLGLEEWGLESFGRRGFRI